MTSIPRTSIVSTAVPPSSDIGPTAAIRSPSMYEPVRVDCALAIDSDDIAVRQSLELIGTLLESLAVGVYPARGPFWS